MSLIIKKIDSVYSSCPAFSKNTKPEFEKIANIQRLINSQLRKANMFASLGDLSKTLLYLSMAEQNLRLKVAISFKLNTI